MEAKGRVKRGRGRPPLRGRGGGRPPHGMRHHRAPASGTHVCDHGVCGILVPKSGKGRLLDDSFVLSRHGQESFPMYKHSGLPRRERARPRKWHPPMVTSDAVSTNGEVHFSNFTSLGDPKRVDLNGHTYPSSSRGDGTSIVGGEGITYCSAAPRLRLILRLPTKSEPKPVNLSSLVDQTAVHVPKRQRTSIDRKPRKICNKVFEERVSNEPLIQSSEQTFCALSASIDHKPRKVSNKLFEERESNEPLMQSSEQMVCALSASVDHEPMKMNTSVLEERVNNEPLIQSPEQFICALSASVDHKPREVNSKLFEERKSNEPLIQSSEQMVCALPTWVPPLPDNIISSRPRIEGWVQVLLAVQPVTVNAQWGRKKKNTSHCNEGKLFPPTEQFMSNDFLLTMDAENLAQVDACLQTFVSKQSSSDELLQAKGDENRAYMERDIHPTSASALNLDPNGYFHHAEEDNQLHVDGNQEGNDPHDVEGVQTVVGHSVLDSALQNGNEELRTQAGESIELLPSEQFTFGDSLQNRLENVANMEGSKQFLATGFSKPKESLQGEEEIMFHAEMYVSECLIKQFFDQELLENETQDERCDQKFSVEQSRPGDDLPTDEMNDSHSKLCLQMPSKFGDDLRTEDKSEALSAECEVTCTAEQYALDDTSQRQWLDNQPQAEQFVQEHKQCSKFMHELQSKKKNESHTEDCVQVPLHEQAKRQDDFPFKSAKNVAHAAGCMIEFPVKDSAICDSFSMHQFQVGSHDELFNQELLVEQKNPQIEFQTEDGNKLYDEKYIQVPHEEQPECGVDLFSEADENGQHAEECVLADPENWPACGQHLQIEELGKGPEDEKFTQEIPTDQHPTGDDLLMEMEYIESHADEGLQALLQEQDKPEDDWQLEDDGSNADSEALAVQLSFEKSDACDFVQIHESEHDTHTGEIIQEPPPKRSKTEHSLQMEENNEILLDGILLGPVTELSKNDDPLHLKPAKSVIQEDHKKSTFMQTVV